MSLQCQNTSSSKRNKRRKIFKKIKIEESTTAKNKTDNSTSSDTNIFYDPQRVS